MAAYAGNLAFGQLTSSAGNAIVTVDLTTGKLTTVSTLAPDAGGLGAMVVDLPWLIWEQLDSQTNSSDWSVHAWNQQTGVSQLLATSRLADGTYLAGQQPLPVVRNAVAAWAQPIRGANGHVQAEIRLVNLTTQQTSTADSGRVSSPVYAGPHLVWATIDDAGAYSFQAVNANTFESVTLANPLHHPGSIGYLAGSSRYLVWSGHDNKNLKVWPVGAESFYNVTPPDADHSFQFMQLAGDFLLWYTGSVSAILDVRTGAMFDIKGTVTGAETQIVAAEPIGQTSTTGQSAMYRISSVSTGIPPVARRC